MPRVVKSTFSSASIVKVVLVFAVVVEMTKERPVALPLVMRIKCGVAGTDSCPAVQPAPVTVRVLVVTLAILPTNWPAAVDSIIGGSEITEVVRPVPDPAAIVSRIPPTGTVVAAGTNNGIANNPANHVECFIGL
jgi:hypothetical protein